MNRPKLLLPERARSMERPFAWIPFRLLSSGLLAKLGPTAALLYFFLCLVADRQGLSFYGARRLCTVLGLAEHDLRQARVDLIDHDLLAFDGRVYQVLSLPQIRSQRASCRHQPLQANSQRSLSEARARPVNSSERAEHLRVILQRLTGD